MGESWQEDMFRGGKLQRQGLETRYGSASLSDRDWALDFLATSKSAVGALTRTLAETADPRLRQLLLSQLNASFEEHFRLADLATAKGWQAPHASPAEQLAADVAAARQAMADRANILAEQ